MGRILFWLVIIFVVIMLYRLLTSKRTSQQQDAVQPKQAPSTSLEACPHCGIHMPHTELIAHIKDTHV